jgi:histidyl-tRNA synthetase
MSEESPAKKDLAAVKGTKDILPAEVGVWQAAESAVRGIFELYGYRELRAPVIEHTELFEKGTGATSDIVVKEMYTFIDKGGRSITLRPEYTPSVARAIIEHRLDLQPAPLRFYYMGPMFRYDKPQKGRYRQFHQIDVEVFGEKDPAIDAELVEMAQALLARLGVGEMKTLVNSVGCGVCRPGYHARLRAAAEAKRAVLCHDCQRKIDINPLRIFDCKLEACREAAASFPRITDHLCPECRDHFDRFRAYLDLYGIPYEVDPTLVRGLDYYTKTAFEIVTTKLGSQNAICGGGRYDDMMKGFGGPDICGIGFAMGMERLLAVADIPVPKKRSLYVAYLGDEARKTAMTLARRFRRAGIECLVEYKARGLKAHLGRASRLEASWVLIVGDDELKAGRFPLKDMASGTQTEGTPEELIRAVKGDS